MTRDGAKVVIAGGSGFMGTAIAVDLRAEGATVITIGRTARSPHSPQGGQHGTGADVAWGDRSGITAAVDGADLVLGLAGKSVNCRYTPRNRAEILSSRIDTTGELGRAIAVAVRPPALWINSSTATIYRHADDRPQTDEDGEIGSGFSVDVATAWEHEFFSHHRDGVRQVALRTAIVLGDGSALAPLLALTRLGLGGPQLGGESGGGRQWFSWIHLYDVSRAIGFIRSHPGIEGTVNLSSPNPVQNRELMRTLRRVLGVPFGIAAAEWMLRLGARAMRTETELLLKSRWVLPTRLEAHGFGFDHPTLEGAVTDIVTDIVRGRRG